MPFGKIVSVPSDYSSYARVRSEYGEEYTVHVSEIPKDSEVGDDFAYHVDVWQHPEANVTTLREGLLGPEEEP